MEHVGVGWLSESFQNKPESQAELDHGDKVVFNNATKQLGCDVQFFVRILWEELVLFKQILDHAVEHILLPLHSRSLELLEQLQNFIN